MKRIFKLLAITLVLINMALLVGCARNNKPSNPLDPYESLNRKTFALNEAIDGLFIRPPTIVYQTLVPSPLRTGVNNAFSNLNEVTVVGNDILQGKLMFAMSDGWRFLINSTIGIGGLFDVASHMGLPKHNEDFGLTLATWGAKQSAYFVMPFFGPSTFRDTFSKPFDLFIISGWPYIKPDDLRYGLLGLWIINTRTKLLAADPLIKQAFDPYAFVRNAYLQTRNEAIAKNKMSYHDYRQMVLNKRQAPDDSANSDADNS